MRWPFGPPQKKNTKTKKETKKTKEKTKKTRKKRSQQKKQLKYPTVSFSIISHIFLFLGGFSKFPFLDTLAQKARTQKHYKIRGFRAFFLESRCASRNGHFWTKKTQIHKFQLSFFFAYFLLFQQQKTPKLLKPLSL